jgi:hypothetical protein
MANNKLRRLAWLTGLALPLVLGTASSSRADGVRMTTCTGGWGSLACVDIFRRGITDPHVRQVPPVYSEREVAEAEDRDRKWLARCRPVMHYDAYGVARLEYAAPGCEHGRID